METATLRRAPPLPGLIQLVLIGSLIVLALIAWAVTDERMAGMDAGPGTDTGELGWFLGIWVVMMAAMMFPSIAPMVLMHVRIQEGRRDRGREVPLGVTPLFVAGYLVAWASAGLAAYGLFELGRAVTGDAFSWDNGGPYLAGGIIVAAALYQLTPLKDVCLRNCRNPLMFLMKHWSDGRIGALRMGVEHGAFCVGCCWMLMAALFALGVMSLGWMAFIAALIAIEKLLPWKAVANRGIAVLLLAIGLTVAIEPEQVPGLILPDSPEAMRAMERMMGGEGSMEGMEGGSMQGEGMEGEGTQGGAMGHEGMGGEEAGGAMDHEGKGGAMNDEGAMGRQGKGGAMPDGMDHP
jgi:predicted metal-binding membrane protein